MADRQDYFQRAPNIPIASTGTRRQLLVGVLAEELAPSGTANMTVQSWNGSGWVASGEVVKVRDGIGMTGSLTSGTRVFANWYEEGQCFLITAAACPT